MKTCRAALGIIIAVSLLGGCKTYEDQTVTINEVSSPKASVEQWQVVSSTKNSQRFESPLGSIEFNKIPTVLKSIEQPKSTAAFSLLKKQVERDFKASNCRLMSATGLDQLSIANQDFLHTSYRTRDLQNQRQRVELYAAPINNHFVTIVVRIGDDADVYSYSDLQSFLTQHIRNLSQA